MDLSRVYRARLGRQIVQVLSIFEKNLSCENIRDATRATLGDEFRKRRKAEKAGHKTRVHGCIYRPTQGGKKGGREEVGEVVAGCFPEGQIYNSVSRTRRGGEGGGGGEKSPRLGEGKREGGVLVFRRRDRKRACVSRLRGYAIPTFD